MTKRQKLQIEYYAPQEVAGSSLEGMRLVPRYPASSKILSIQQQSRRGCPSVEL